MKLKDFKHTKSLLKKSMKGSFCLTCGKKSPELHDGYTVCCNDRAGNFTEALSNMIQSDVVDYLSQKFEISSYKESLVNVYFTVELINKKKKFTVYPSTDLNYVLKQINENTKGYRRER